MLVDFTCYYRYILVLYTLVGKVFFSSFFFGCDIPFIVRVRHDSIKSMFDTVSS